MDNEEQDCDMDALMLCEYCQGPIAKLKKYGNSGKQFCSKQCAESQVDKSQVTSACNKSCAQNADA